MGLIGIGSLLSTILTCVLTYFLEVEKFKRGHRIAFAKEGLDNFYSPMIQYFDIMKSWADFRKSPQTYIWANDSLQEKRGQMYEVMQTCTRFVSPSVRMLWSQWEPRAIAATTGGQYPEFKRGEFLTVTEKLHKALLHDRDELLKKYMDMLTDESVSVKIKRKLTS